MLSYVAHYVLFLLETITLVAAILAVVIGVAALKQKGKLRTKEGFLTIKSLEQRYQQVKLDMLQSVATKKEMKAALKTIKKADKTKSEVRKRIYVIDFKGDIQASAVSALREEITAILQVVSKQDEVLVKLESPGGVVHGYGLAASQLDRIRSRCIPLTVAVDKVAASGGYMMACVADKILAAPFAIVGSIGVLAQIPNFHRWLQKHEVDFEQLTAGDYKRTLSLFGKNTEQGREKFQHELEQTHTLFKDFIQHHRAQVDLAQVATGEHWFGQQALALQLVDELLTSDDYLLQAYQEGCAIFEVRYHNKTSLTERMRQTIKAALLYHPLS